MVTKTAEMLCILEKGQFYIQNSMFLSFIEFIQCLIEHHN